MTQATLFDGPHVEARPLTSDQTWVINALASGPATAYELQTRLAGMGIHRQQNCVAKRLSELAELGLIERTGERRPGASSRKLDEWRIA